MFLMERKDQGKGGSQEECGFLHNLSSWEIDCVLVARQFYPRAEWPSHGRSATVLAWLANQGGDIVRKYVSLKECNLFFVLFY